MTPSRDDTPQMTPSHLLVHGSHHRCRMGRHNEPVVMVGYLF